MGPDIEMKASNEGIELAITSSQEHNKSTVNGLAAHMEVELSAEEIKAEKRYVLKVDCTILPLLVLSVFLASLDRGDVSYAYKAGMQTQLKITPSQYSTITSMFYVGYCVMSLPATLLMKKVTGRVQIAVAIVLWGLFTALMGQCKNYESLAGLRVLIGGAEALNQAAGLYLTFFYRRDQLASRGSFYFGVYSLAGAFNGLLAYAIITDLNGTRGWLAWKWLFLIEGVMSIFTGFVVFICMPGSPEKLSRFFTANEKQIALRRYREGYNVEGDTKIRASQVFATLKDPHTWIYCSLYCCLQASLTSMGSFLPLIVGSFGYSTLYTDLLTIPVWTFTAICVVFVGFYSDRIKQRGWLLCVCFAVTSIGLILLLAEPPKGGQLVAVFFIGAGTYPAVVLTQTWYASNMIGYTKRATCTALLFMSGQCFGIAASYAYSDPPYYRKGNGYALAFNVVGFVLTFVQIRLLMRRNAKKLAAANTPEVAALRLLGVEEIQDGHPDFLYYL